MSILCTVVSTVKLECVDEFALVLASMFSETKHHEGFISIRLLKSGTAVNEFIMLQEWQSIEHHQSYMAFRAERGDLDRLVAMTDGPMSVHYWAADPLASA